jgi:hypothetical protein
VKLWKSAFALEKSGDDNTQDYSSGASFLFSAKQRQAIADSIGDPAELPNFFPSQKLHTDIEAMLQSQKRSPLPISVRCIHRRSFIETFYRDIPSSDSSKYSNWLHRDLSAELMSKKEEPDSTSKDPVVPPSSSSSSGSGGGSSPPPAASVSNVSQQLENMTVASPVVGLSSPAHPVSHVSATVDPADSGAVCDPCQIVFSFLTCNVQAIMTKPRSWALLSPLNKCVFCHNLDFFATGSHITLRLPQLLQLPWTTSRKSLTNLGASNYDNKKSS